MRHARRSVPPVGRPGGRSLPPLRWVAGHDLLYDATNTLHRPHCRHASEITAAWRLAVHEALELVWAPGSGSTART